MIGMNTSTVSSDYASENSLDVAEPSVMESTVIKTPSRSEASEVGEAWSQTGQRTANFLANFPFDFARFFSQNRRAMTSILIALATFIGLKVIFAVLDALDDIPFLSTLLQLVGLGYSLSFVNRYLLKAENRQELFQQIQGITKDVSSPPAGLLQADTNL